MASNSINVFGISSLLHKDEIASEVDLKLLEKQILEGKPQTTYRSFADEFKKETDKLDKLFDFPQMGGGGGLQDPALYDFDKQSQPGASPYQPQQSPYQLQTQPSPYQPQQSPYQLPTQTQPQQSPYQLTPLTHDVKPLPQLSNWGNAPRTKEEESAAVLRSVLSNPPHKQEEVLVDLMNNDESTMLIEEIRELKTLLHDNGVKVDDIQDPKPEMSKYTLKTLHDALIYRNHRHRAEATAEEICMLGAKALEWIFNGERELLGYKLDARGWSSTAKTKLRKMKYDTSAFVTQIMKEYSMSRSMRVALELVPSFILYVSTKSSKGTKDLSKNFSDGMHNLND